MENKKRLVVLSGAGISAESGLQTFRDSNGLWEGNRVEDVATPEAFQRDPETVHRFYNMRRAQCRKAQPNLGHQALVELEKYYHVDIITQNVDDLHERAGSKSVLHLHGQILKSQSSLFPDQVFEMEGDEIKVGDLCPFGSPLRPHIVWFGESVPNMDKAIALANPADIFVVVGTSLKVYPAAGLIGETNNKCEVYLIDPNASEIKVNRSVTIIPEIASSGVSKLVKLLTK